MKISVCGKGGSGKSTLVTLLALQAVAGKWSVLVIDSDESNSGLFRMLGFDHAPVPLMEALGGKQHVKQKMNQSSILRENHIEIRSIPDPHIQRRNGLAQVSIGKIMQALEGCACPMGVLSREFLKKLTLQEGEIAIVDMEAGVEHFGRGIDEAIDRVLLVVEPSRESITVAEKVRDLAAGMDKRSKAVLNKMPSPEVAQRVEEELRSREIDIIGRLPNDPQVFEACLEGRIVDRGKAFDAAGDVLSALLS